MCLWHFFTSFIDNMRSPVNSFSTRRRRRRRCRFQFRKGLNIWMKTFVESSLKSSKSLYQLSREKVRVEDPTFDNVLTAPPLVRASFLCILLRVRRTHGAIPALVWPGHLFPVLSAIYDARCEMCRGKVQSVKETLAVSFVYLSGPLSSYCQQKNFGSKKKKRLILYCTEYKPNPLVIFIISPAAASSSSSSSFPGPQVLQVRTDACPRISIGIAHPQASSTILIGCHLCHQKFHLID